MDVVIFGTAPLSSVAWYCLTHDSGYRVVAFTVDRDHIESDSFHGLPVYPFEDLEGFAPPSRVKMLVPIGFSRLNRIRMERYEQARSRGYEFATYVSSRAIVWPDLTIGENCMVYDGAAVQPFAKIGNNVVIRSGAIVSHHAEISDHCFIAAHGVVAGSTRVGERCVLGLNSTVRDGVTVAERCIVAAGAVVAGDTEPDGVYLGVPAKRGPSAAEGTL